MIMSGSNRKTVDEEPGILSEEDKSNGDQNKGILNKGVLCFKILL